jgi:hypothetical protein
VRQAHFVTFDRHVTGAQAYGPSPHWRDRDEQRPNGSAAGAPSSPQPSIPSRSSPTWSALTGAFLSDQDAIRGGLRKLLARWEKDVAANKEWWRKQRKRTRR